MSTAMKKRLAALERKATPQGDFNLRDEWGYGPWDPSEEACARWEAEAVEEQRKLMSNDLKGILK